MSCDSRLYWLWARQLLGAGTRRAQRAMEHFGDARRLFEADEDSLIASGIFSPDRAKTILERDLTQARRVLTAAAEQGMLIITPEQDSYPALLRDIYSPPLCLFVAGDLSYLSPPLPIAMVGTRKPSDYGTEIAKLCAGGLAAAGATVISGLAVGIDAVCHTAALDAGGDTIAVLGCGCDVGYPRQNSELRDRIEKNGCVISEYPPGTPPLPGHFPVRNRIISGMARGCVVVQAAAKSGSLITAGMALGQNRDVFALCGPVTDPLMSGCHELIRQGAKPVFGIEDILGEYPSYTKALAAVPAVPARPARQKAAAPSSLPEYLTEKQLQIVKLLRQSAQSVEAMAQSTGLPAGQLLGLLTELEIYGLVEPSPGRTYRAV